MQGAAAEVPAKLSADLLTTVKANWTLWVPAQIINFTFMPVSMQVRPRGCSTRGDGGCSPSPLQPGLSLPPLPPTVING